MKITYEVASLKLSITVTGNSGGSNTQTSFKEGNDECGVTRIIQASTLGRQQEIKEMKYMWYSKNITLNMN